MKLSKIHITLLFFVSFSFIIQGQTNNALKTFVADTSLRHAQISFTIRDVASNSAVISYNSQKSCTPASVTKLITTATALEILGPEYRFKTILETDGYVDPEGTLQGNLYITGNGDPTLGSKYFKDTIFIQTWISQLKEKGIRNIYGNIMADASLYDQQPVPVLWLREDLGNYYGAGVFPVAVFDNTTLISLKSKQSGSKPEIIKTFPDVGYFYENNLSVISCKKDNICVLGEPYNTQRTLQGTVRENQNIINVKGDISNPPLFLAQYFGEKLKEAGISINGQAEVSYTKPQEKRFIIYTHQSPPLSEIIKVTNVFSNNNFAEHLLKHLSLQKDSTANFDSALKLVRDFWMEKGIDVSGLFMYDGSGLSPKNAICADFITDILAYMKQKSSYVTTFYASLPIAGKNGTVEFFLKDTSLSGKVHVKSGSFRNVQCYAGYISKNNKEYVFCIMINNFIGERKKVVQLVEQLLNNFGE